MAVPHQIRPPSSLGSLVDKILATSQVLVRKELELGRTGAEEEIGRVVGLVLRFVPGVVLGCAGGMLLLLSVVQWFARSGVPLWLSQLGCGSVLLGAGILATLWAKHRATGSVSIRRKIVERERARWGANRI